MKDGIDIRHELRCGDLGRIVTLHGECYEPLPGFGLRFEAFVARTIAEFVLDNEANGRVWLAERGETLVGCTAIALRDDDRAQLRWVLVDPSARGIGLGRRLGMGLWSRGSTTRPHLHAGAKGRSVTVETVTISRRDRERSG